MAKRREIRNSTAEFLIFQIENKEQGIEVMCADETIWCTQKAMAALFDVGVPAISKHLANVFETGELNDKQKNTKVYNILRKLRESGRISNITKGNNSLWSLAKS